MRKFRLAVVPGDGIGAEVIPAGLKVLKQVADVCATFGFETQEFDWGSARYLREGAMMPRDAMQQLERGGFDAILDGPGRRSARLRPHHTLGPAVAHPSGV